MAIIDKTQSQTYKQLKAKKDINDILNQSNISLKERHNGLLIKFNNDINNIKNKELTTQINTTEEKSNINLKKYLYNSLTIFEDKKISKLRQKIHNELIPELDKKTIEKIKLLSSQDIIISDISKIKKELLELRNNLIEEKMTININERIKNQKITDNEIRKVSDLEIDIKNIFKNKKILKTQKNIY